MWDTKFGFPPEPPSSPAGVAAPSPKRRREEGVAEMREEAVERLRGVVRDNVGKHLYASAIFLADKVAAATGDPADVYMLAQALFLDRHFRRALHLSSPLLRDLRFRFLAASSPPSGAASAIPLPCIRWRQWLGTVRWHLMRLPCRGFGRLSCADCRILGLQ